MDTTDFLSKIIQELQPALSGGYFSITSQDKNTLHLLYRHFFSHTSEVICHVENSLPTVQALTDITCREDAKEQLFDYFREIRSCKFLNRQKIPVIRISFGITEQNRIYLRCLMNTQDKEPILPILACIDDLISIFADAFEMIGSRIPTAEFSSLMPGILAREYFSIQENHDPIPEEIERAIAIHENRTPPPLPVRNKQQYYTGFYQSLYTDLSVFLALYHNRTQTDFQTLMKKALPKIVSSEHLNFVQSNRIPCSDALLSSTPILSLNEDGKNTLYILAKIAVSTIPAYPSQKLLRKTFFLPNVWQDAEQLASIYYTLYR